VVETSQWGGLMLTLVLAVVSMVLALPFVVLLALGRRSRLPVIRAAYVAYIELWRGVPLITVLFQGGAGRDGGTGRGGYDHALRDP